MSGSGAELPTGRDEIVRITENVYESAPRGSVGPGADGRRLLFPKGAVLHHARLRALATGRENLTGIHSTGSTAGDRQAKGRGPETKA